MSANKGQIETTVLSFKERMALFNKQKPQDQPLVKAQPSLNNTKKMNNRWEKNVKENQIKVSKTEVGVGGDVDASKEALMTQTSNISKTSIDVKGNISEALASLSLSGKPTTIESKAPILDSNVAAKITQFTAFQIQAKELLNSLKTKESNADFLQGGIELMKSQNEILGQEQNDKEAELKNQLQIEKNIAMIKEMQQMQEEHANLGKKKGELEALHADSEKRQVELKDLKKQLELNESNLKHEQGNLNQKVLQLSNLKLNFNYFYEQLNYGDQDLINQTTDIYNQCEKNEKDIVNNKKEIITLGIKINNNIQEISATENEINANLLRISGIEKYTAETKKQMEVIQEQLQAIAEAIANPGNAGFTQELPSQQANDTFEGTSNNETEASNPYDNNNPYSSLSGERYESDEKGEF